MTELIQPIPARLKNVAVGGHVAGADQIIDDEQNKTQEQINAEVLEAIGTGGSVDTKITNAINALDATASKSAGADGLALSVTEENGKVTAINGSIAANTYAPASDSQRIADLETAVGTGGSVDERIEDATENCAYLGEDDGSETIADFDPQADSLWKGAQVLSSAEKAQVKTNLGLPQEIYSKTEVNNLITTPNQQYVTVATYASLPASGSADTIYRVSNYNGSTSQVDATVYSEYAWNGTAYEFLCAKSQVGEVFDISAYNSNTKYADLAAALGTNGANVPEGLRKGGMSVKFVSNSDNKYVQYRLMANSFTTDTTQWCGVNKELFAFSKNIVESGGIFDANALIKFDINEQFPYEGYYDKDNNGAFVSNASYRVSVLIPFTSGNITVNHTSKNPHANSLSFFDSSKNFIGGIDIPSAQADTEKTYTYISISSQFPSTAFMAVCTSPNSEAYIKINSIGTLRMEDEKINGKILQVQDNINIDEQIIFGYPFKDNYFWNNSGVRTYHSGFICTDKIKLEGIIYIYAVGTNRVGSSVSNVVFFKEDGSVSSITPTMTWSSSEKKVLYHSSFPSDASYAAFNAVANNKDIAFVRVDKGSIQQMILNTGFNVWADKNGVCYGDSITAMNPSYVDNLITNSVFKQTLRRAVGGQTFKWNSACYYCEREGDGAYLDRYIYDAQGQNTGVVVTKNISAEDIANIENHYGVQIDIHYGCFCSWDRITAMIPESIRESINAIILMGGTNDWNSNEDISANIPEWSSANTTDNEWINSSLYNGGDYDVTTFAGAFMSTIMKFQKWCPNAIIIVCTPYGNWDNTTKKQTVNTINKTVQDYANKEKELATYLAYPIIDINSLTTVNAFNRGEYFVDNIHPSTKGSALIANVIIEKLNGIYPNPN